LGTDSIVHSDGVSKSSITTALNSLALISGGIFVNIFALAVSVPGNPKNKIAIRIAVTEKTLYFNSYI